MNKTRKASGFSNIGFSTILFSFVMICVVTFSALSLTTAYSDYKLSKKAATHNSAYYEAQEKVYDKLQSIDKILIECYKNASSQEEYYQLAKEQLANLGYGEYKESCFYFEEVVAERQTLEIVLQISYPTKDTDTFFQIIEWKSIYEEILPEEEMLDLVD